VALVIQSEEDLEDEAELARIVHRLDTCGQYFLMHALGGFLVLFLFFSS
jgi:hypothetical protein